MTDCAIGCAVLLGAAIQSGGVLAPARPSVTPFGGVLGTVVTCRAVGSVVTCPPAGDAEATAEIATTPGFAAGCGKPTGAGLVLTRSRGHFPFYGEGVRNGQASWKLRAGVPA